MIRREHSLSSETHWHQHEKIEGQSPRSNRTESEQSFLDIPALKQSFADKESSSSGDSQDQSFDVSSQSNPYETSSDSDDEVIREESSENELGESSLKGASQSKQQLHTFPHEKSMKNAQLLLQQYITKEVNEFADIQDNSSKLIKSLTLPKFDILLFYIAANAKERDEDASILREKLRKEFLDKHGKSSDEQLNQILQSLLGESKDLSKERVLAVFIEHSAYFFQRVCEDKRHYYDLFKEILSSGEISTGMLSSKIFVRTSTLEKLLEDKKYLQLLYLVQSSVRILHANPIGNYVRKEEEGKSTFEGYLNQPLLKVNLKLLAIYFTSKLKDFNIVKRLLFDASQSPTEYYGLLRVFIQSRANSLAKEIFRALADTSYVFDNNLILFTLQCSNFEFLWFLAHHSNFLVSNWMQDEKAQQMLVESLYSTEGKSFEYIIYFLKRVKRLKMKQTVKRMSETLIYRMNSCRQGQFMYTFYNPLKIALLVVELTQQTLVNVMHHRNRLQKALDLYYRFAQIFCSLITDDHHLIDLFKDVDLEKRKVIFLIDSQKSAIILSSQNVEDAIESMWNGNTAPKADITKMFSVTQSLFHQDLDYYTLTKETRAGNSDVFLKLNESYQNHHFCLQRVVWTYNCRIRNQIDQCLIILLIFLIFMNFFSLFEPQRQIQILREQQPSPDDLEALEMVQVKSIQDIYMQWQLYLDLIVGLNFTFKPLFIRFYDWSLSQNTSFNAQDYNGFLLGLLSLFQIGFILNLENIEEPQRFSILLHFRWIYISISTLQWIHAIRNFKVFGPMIKALWLVVLECSKLFFIFLIVEMMFGFAAYFSFYQNINNQFKSLTSTLLFLVEALFGQFSFQDFSQPSSLYAPIFLNIYLFFSPIIFMQLIVAVLTFTFETASRSGRIHYFLGIIDNLRNLEYDGVCGTLVTFPIVGSIFNIFFILTHMFADPDPALKESNIDTLKRVNRVLVRCGYYPIFFLLMLLSLVIVLVSAPILYVVKSVRIILESHKGEEYSRWNKLLKWLAFGFFYMGASTYRDFRTNYQYLMNGKFLNDSPQINISNNTYAILAAVAKDFYLKTRERQSKVKLSEYLNAVMKRIKAIEQKEAEKKKIELERLQQQQPAPPPPPPPPPPQLQFENNTAALSPAKLKKSEVDHSLNKNLKLSVMNILTERNLTLIELPLSPAGNSSRTNIDLNTPNNNGNGNAVLVSSKQTKKDLQGSAKEQLAHSNTESRSNQRHQYFANKIKSLIPQESEEDLTNIGEITESLVIPSELTTKEKPIEGNQTNKKKRQYVPSIIMEEGNSHYESPYAVKLPLQREPRASILFLDRQPSAFQSRDRISSTVDTNLQNFPRRSSMRHTFFEMPGQQKRKVDHINFELATSQDSDEQVAKTTENKENAHKKYLRNLARHQSNGSLTGRHSLKTNHQTQLQAYENSVHQRKRQKTTYQMWKKLKKEDSNKGTYLIKESDHLYQFIESYVIDEDEMNTGTEVSPSNDQDEESNELIYIENLLKLMHHYSKNDVKLAKFTTLYQAIKKLYKNE